MCFFRKHSQLFLLAIGVLMLSTPVFSNVYFDDLFYDHGTVMMVLNGATGEIVEANHAASDFYGYPLEVLLRMNISQINSLPPEVITQEMELARLQKRNYFEFIHKRADGSTRFVEVYSYPYTLPSGEVYLYSIVHDVTEKMDAQRQAKLTRNWLFGLMACFICFVLYVLYRSNASRKAIAYKSGELQSLFENITEGFISVDASGIIKTVNPMGLSLLQMEASQPIGKPIDLIYKRFDEASGLTLSLNLNHQEKSQMVLIENTKGGKVPVEETVVPIMPTYGKIEGYVIAFKDMTEQRQKQKHIEFLSYHDQLTGLYNRRFFEEELKRLDVVRNYPLSLMMLDVNGLKLVNDAFGHVKGDQLLITLASVLKSVFRADDIVARTGGDEFVVLLPKTSENDAIKLKNRLNQMFKKTHVGCIAVSAGIGTATKTIETEVLSELVKVAETAMYKEKLTGSFEMKHATIDRILEGIKSRNEREQVHNECVARWAKALAIDLGLSERQVQLLETAGLLHDIGKVAIEDAIFEKKDSLTALEWHQIKKHPEIGYHILKSVDEYVEIADWVLSHHEWYDGSGYPRGIEGIKLPIQSRILCVADAYAAMVHPRAYRGAKTSEEALEELKRFSGKQFDPKVVTHMVHIVEAERTAL